MPEQNGEKTQDPTPHRRQKAREEGQVAKSQDLASSEHGFKPLPIVYFTQVLGLALGQDDKLLGFDENKWDARPLLEEKEV